MSQIMTRAYRYLIEAGAFNVPNPVVAKATAMRRLMDEGVRPDIADSAVRNAFNDTVRPNKPTPALDWKPINITQMQPDKDYLVWGHKWNTPDVAYLTGAGYFISERTEAYDDEHVTYREADLTHYAEFNKPEGR